MELVQNTATRLEGVKLRLLCGDGNRHEQRRRRNAKPTRPSNSDPRRSRSARQENIGESTHTGGEVDRSPAGSDLDLAPRLMDIEEDEQVSGSIGLPGGLRRQAGKPDSAVPAR
jgi:hypothetical protein